MPTPPGPDALTLDCPAKLNLTLAVGPPRADGLHPIASVMAAIDCCDTLTLRRMPGGPSRFERWVARDALRPITIDWPIERDLIFRAATLMDDQAGRALPIDCHLTKRIPHGAGLGGGSSDAAGVLIGVRRLFDLPIDDERLIELGLTLGADVGFLVSALLGQRAAVVTGIGDVIRPMPGLPAFHAVLIFPEERCPTAEVYAAHDAIKRQGPSQPLDALASGWLVLDQRPEPFNDLAQAAARVCPAIARSRSVLLRSGLEAQLSGSGSTLFVLTESRQAAQAQAAALCGAGLAACASSFVPTRRS